MKLYEFRTFIDSLKKSGVKIENFKPNKLSFYSIIQRRNQLNINILTIT